MPAVQLGIETLGLEPKLFAGGIGQKLNQIKTFLTPNPPKEGVGLAS